MNKLEDSANFNDITTQLSSSSPNKKNEEQIKQRVPCVDDYEILKLISNGAYGAVYLGKNQRGRDLL